MRGFVVAEEETVIREVDQSMAEDRQAEFLRKRGPAILGASGALVLAVAGWQVWKSQKVQAAEEASTAYWEATKSIEQEAETGEAAFQLIAERETSGYAGLAKFKLASIAVGNGAPKEALGHYASIFNDNGVSKRVRDLARIKAGYLAIEEGRDEALRIVGQLETDESPLGDHAREIIALAALEAEDYQTAETMFLSALSSPGVSSALRARAEQFVALASAGKAGVPLETKTGVDGFLDALEDRGSDLGSLLQSTTDAAGDVAIGPDVGFDGHDHASHADGIHEEAIEEAASDLAPSEEAVVTEDQE